MGPDTRKPNCCMQTTKAQTSGGIPAVWSAPLLFTQESMIMKVATCKILDILAKQTGFSLAKSETLKTGFFRDEPHMVHSYGAQI